MVPTEWRPFIEAIYSVLVVLILGGLMAYALGYIAPHLVNTKLSSNYKVLLYSFLAVGVGIILLILIFFTSNGLAGWVALAMGLLSWVANGVILHSREEPKQ